MGGPGLTWRHLKDFWLRRCGVRNGRAQDTSLPKMPTPTATPRGVATPRQDEHSLVAWWHSRWWQGVEVFQKLRELLFGR